MCQWWRTNVDLQIRARAWRAFSFMFIKAVLHSWSLLKFRPQTDQSSVGSIWTRTFQIYQIHKEEIRAWIEDYEEWRRTSRSWVWKLQSVIRLYVNKHLLNSINFARGSSCVSIKNDIVFKLCNHLLYKEEIYSLLILIFILISMFCTWLVLDREVHIRILLLPILVNLHC